mgnify:CR=1 FL=1
MKSKYSKYSSDIQSFMNGVEKHLISRYGEIDESWNLSLILLADTIQTYNECQKILSAEGYYNKQTKLKNPLLSTVKDCVATINKITSLLGCSPWSASKIKISEADDTDDFLENLTK